MVRLLVERSEIPTPRNSHYWKSNDMSVTPGPAKVCGDGDFEGELERAKNEVEKTRNELQSKEANKFTYREQIDRLTAMKENSAVKPRYGH